MSLMDQLRSEAKQRRVTEAQSKVLNDRLSWETEAKLRPRMVALHRYFKEFIDHLSVLNPDVETACEVAEFGRVAPLKQGTYRFWTAVPDDPTRFTFGFTATSRERPQIRLASPVAEKTLGVLHAANIPCTAGQVGTEHTTLVLQPEIPVLFEFSMDLAAGVVRLSLRNHEKLGTLGYAYRPEQINEELMEQLGLMILGKDNRFKTLSGGSVDEESREQLKRALGRERRRRQAELGGAMSKIGWAVGEGVRRLFGRG